MLRRLAYYKVLHRPNLYLSGERAPTLGLVFLVFVLVVTTVNIPGFVLAGLFWFFGLPALQKMAKRNAQMVLTYLRHISYRAHYPAHSRAGVRVSRACSTTYS